MKSELIALALALKELGCSSVSTFSNRLMLQKKIFLAQQLGLNFGYRYNWYLHGPYSPDLTGAAFEIKNEDGKGLNDWILDEPKLAVLRRINQFSESREDCTEESWYELLSSLVYLHKEYKFTSLPQTEVFDILRIDKPWYTDIQLHRAWAFCQQQGLVQ